MGTGKRLDGFGTRAVHVGSDPDPSTGALIPAISLSPTYKQEAVGKRKVRMKECPLHSSPKSKVI
ncbi:hypothetical protein F5148DRAFT_1188424 [Russula earlei]|uniref:Uncharacterized protein n=1 Tax=Russula earlei TaxID=71964 RepID=A0ACC0UCW6_9AGAM|nr:hypothetical protein F5148DRAFT_1188424 [Russula earlei]